MKSDSIEPALMAKPTSTRGILPEILDRKMSMLLGSYFL